MKVMHSSFWAVVLCVIVLALAWASDITITADAKDTPPELQSPAVVPVGATSPGEVLETPSTGIAWFQGNVDAAFEHAKAEGKPVFLYWSAEWCPPCHELQARLFTRPEFQEKLKLFVPVYLDADAPGVQKWSDVFRIVGYPTLVVLKGDRTELTRIIGGMDLARYNDVLDLVLGDVQPVDEILASLDSSDGPLSRDDCRRLAYNSWLADESTDAAPAETASVLQRAADRCPADAGTERARLTIAAALASSNADAEALRAGKAPSAMTARLVQRVYEVLDDRQSTMGAADTFTWLGEEFFAAVKAESENTPEFLTRWSRMTQGVADNPNASDSDRVGAIAFELRAMKALLEDGKIPAKVADTARQRVQTALSKESVGNARASVVNFSVLVFNMLGDVDRSFAILEQELKAAKQPYYYMSGLANLEEQRGNKDKAISWLERAYRESHGEATRFQWGTDYILGLVRMRPDDAAGIREAALTILGELDGQDRIYMRTASRLKRLDSTLRDWNRDGAHTTDIAALRKRMDSICAKIPEEETARENCDAFLEGEASIQSS